MLTASTRASGTRWALGVAPRSRELVTAGDGAETVYREAVAGLQRMRLRLDLARARLVYGAWRRRARRRMEARPELRLVFELFTGFGMEAFAERTRI